MSLFGTILGGVIGGAGNILAAKKAGGDIERQGVLNREARQRELDFLTKSTEFESPLGFQLLKMVSELLVKQVLDRVLHHEQNLLEAMNDFVLQELLHSHGTLDIQYPI